MNESRPAEREFAQQGLAAPLLWKLSNPAEERFWFRLAMALGVLAASVFLIVGLSRPGALQDDARMFLSWMGRWDDPAPLAGDLMADYWSSVSPWFFKAAYRAAWLVGIPPLLFAKLLPPPLFILAVFFTYRFARAIGASPQVAFGATALTLLTIGGSDTLVSATPRAFWPTLLMVILDGVARGRIVQTAVAQLLLAGAYPQAVLVTSGMIGLTMFDPASRRLDLGRRRLLLVGASAVAAAVGIAPFLLQGHAFDPIVTLAQARAMPFFQAGGRSDIFLPDGSIDFLCGRRMGFFNCRPDQHWLFWISAVFTALGPIVLFARRLNSTGPRSRRMSSPLPFYLLISGIGWFLVAAMSLFQMHVPSRYADGMALLGCLTTLPLLFEWVQALGSPTWLLAHRGGRSAIVGGFFTTIALAAAGAALAPARFVQPQQPELIAAIRALPRNAVVAGMTNDLDFSPAMTNRSTLFNHELAVGYQLGYFGRFSKRIEDISDVVLTHDPAIFADRLERNKVDLLIMDETTLLTPRIPREYRGFFGPELASREAEASAGGPTVLSRLAAACRCRAYNFVIALDARCLVRQARAEAATH